MRLLDVLVGEKRIYVDSVLGNIVSERIKKNHKNKTYLWFADYTLPNAKEDTSIILDGTDKQPNLLQLKALKQLLQNTADLYAKVALAVKGENHTRPLEEKLIVDKWDTEYYIADIEPLEGLTTDFYIWMEPIDERKKGAKYINFCYINGEVTELEYNLLKL